MNREEVKAALLDSVDYDVDGAVDMSLTVDVVIELIDQETARLKREADEGVWDWLEGEADQAESLTPEWFGVYDWMRDLRARRPGNTATPP